MASVTYTKQMTLLPAVDPTTPGCRATPTVKLKVVITAAPGFPDLGVFVYLRDTVSAVSKFKYVANPADITTYAFANPVDSRWFRLDTVELVLENLTLANEALATIELNLQRLCTEQGQVATLGTPVTATITGV